MPFKIVRTAAVVTTTAFALLLAGCTVPPKPVAEAVAVLPAPPPVAPPPAITVTPVEAEPVAPAVQPTRFFTQIMQGPVAAMLQYADRVRSLSGAELGSELARLGDPGDVPTTQMQVALILAQTRVPADLARALGLLQRVNANPSSDAQLLQPLARALASRYAEQRRVEDDRERVAQQLRENQRRIDQLNDRLEALRAIERSFARPNSGNNNGATPAAPAPAATRPAP